MRRDPTIRRINVVQGEARAALGDKVVLTTLLGSCVAACIRDPESGIGGMNHFLLPGDLNVATSVKQESYGVYLMELLINELLKMGARRHALEAKVFGGARTVEGLSDIGTRNVESAMNFLHMENITFLGGSTGGSQGRRIEFCPGTGRARQSLMLASRVAVPETVSTKAFASLRDTGELELL